MWHIAGALADHGPVVDIREGEARISGVRFIAPSAGGYDPRFAYLYVDEDGPADEAVFLSNGPDIVVVRGTSANALLNEVLEVFDLHNHWEARLWEAAAAGSLQQLVDVGCDMLDNPLMVADASGRVLAMSSAHRDIDINDYWVEARETGLVPAAVLGAPRYTEAGRPTRWTHAASTFVLEDGTRTIGAVLMSGGSRAGGVAAWERETPISRSHVQDMRVLCHVIESSGLLERAERSVRGVGAIVRDLVDGREIDPVLLAELDVGFEPPWQLAFVWSPSQGPDSYARNMVARLAQSPLPCAPFPYGEGVCMLAPSGSCERILSGTLTDTGAHPFTAAVSLPFGDLALAGAHYALLDFARRTSGPQAKTVRAQDFALSYFARKLEDSLPVKDLLHPALAVLEANDAATGGDLLRTLEALLENERNRVRTAEQLGVHRNSLSHRIRRIEELAGIDLDDPAERAYLRASIAVSGAG